MNKKSIFKQVLLLLFLFFSEKAQAQKADKIHRMDGLTVPVIVLETEGDSISYRPYFDSKSKIIFSMPKSDVEKIVYQNGTFEYYGGKAIQYPPRNLLRESDDIYKKDGSILSAKVVSTNGDSIKYQGFLKTSDNLIFSLPKTDVDKIYFKSGFIEYFSGKPWEILQAQQKQQKRTRDSVQAHLDKQKNLIKISPFTLGKSYMVVGYERSTGNQQSAEVKFGIIGLIEEKYELAASGMFGSISYKFINKPDGVPKRPRSPLHGSYFRPEVAFGAYNQIYIQEIYRGGTKLSETKEGKHHISYRSLVLNIGKQWIRDGLVLDLFMGGGIGSYEQSASSFGIVRASRFAYRMNMPSVKGSSNVKFKIGLYIGYNF